MVFAAGRDGVGDTQIMDVDPSSSDCETDDGTSGGGDDEIPILYGETQVMDDAESVEGDGGEGVDDGGKTQLVDTYEETVAIDGGKTQLVDTYEETIAVDGVETQLVDYEETVAVEEGDGDGSERTEVLSDDDQSTDCRTARRLSYGENGGADCMVNVDDPALREWKDGEDSVDSDASTDDDDENAGPLRRSFTAVRVAAVRTCGLAAACYVASNKLDCKFSSNGNYDLKDGNAAAGQINSGGIRVGNWKQNIKDLTSLSNETAELDLDHDVEVSRIPTQNFCKEGVKSRSSNARVKKLFDEMAPSEKAESASDSENIIEQEDTLHLFETDHVAAGLSYINSQEPGEFSQANALEVVDKFLLINDMESSEELKNTKSDITKCPPVSCRKGVQLLAEKTDRSPVGKTGIFEWNDSLEDEGGGDFFCKRKVSFFGTSCVQKTKSHLSRASHSISAINRGGFAKSRKTYADPSNCKKITLAHSDSKLIVQDSTKFERVHISEAKTRKSLFKDIDEESSPKLSKHQSEATDAQETLQDAYDVGPNTQMAAEVLEGLVHGSPLKPEKKDRPPAARSSIKKSSKGSVLRKASSNNVLLQKRTSPGHSEGIITQAKRRKILPVEGSPKPPREHLVNSRMKKKQEKVTSKVKVKKEKLKVGNQVDGSSSVGANMIAESFKKGKAQGIVDRTLIKDVRKSQDQKASNRQILARKELTQRGDRGDSTPVASRTRLSNRVNVLKQSKTLLKENESDKDELLDASNQEALHKEVNIGTGAFRAVESKVKHPNRGLHQKTYNSKTALIHPQVQNSGTVLEEEIKVSLFEQNFFNHPKRRRTSQITSGNQNSKKNVNDPSVPGDNMAKGVDRHSKQVRKKVYIRSVADILDKAMRKKRSVSARILLEADGLPSTTTCAPTTSHLKTVLSLKSTSFQMDLENNPEKCPTPPISPQVVSKMAANHQSNGLMNHGSHLEEIISRKSGADYNKDTQRNTKIKGLPPNLACTRPSKEIGDVSPVCLARDTPRSPKKSSSVPSLVRELLRLEPSMTSFPILKDVRRRKAMASIRILFSQHLDEDTVKQQKKILVRLGLKVASSISDATHFVTDKFVRTQNMLEAIAVGKPVVTPMWLEICGQEHCFIDERNYILRDSKKEKEIGFSLPVSLARASQCPLVQNKRVYITPNVKPSRQVIASLVKATGGQAIERIGRSAMKQDKVPDDLLVLSCDEDYSICIPLLKKGAGIFSCELLLNGIVIQKLEYDRHRLFSDHVKRTRSTLWVRPEEGGQFLPVNKCV